MGSSGWTADRLNFILPPGAVPPATFIYVGDSSGDPYGALAIAGLDAGFVLYFGSAPYAYVLGIFQEFGFNDGHFYLTGVDTVAVMNHPLIETDWQPPSAGGGVNSLTFAGDQSVFIGSSTMDISASSGDLRISASGTLQLGEHSFFPGSTWPTNIDGELYIRNNEIGRGVWMSVGSQASSAAIGTTETAILTLPSKTYVAGRAYRVYVHAGVNANTAGSFADMRLHKTNPAGQTLAEFYRTPCPTVSISYAQHAVCEFIVGASDVTAQLAITLAASAGTVTQFASATSARTATVEDIGSAAQITGTVSVLV